MSTPAENQHPNGTEVKAHVADRRWTVLFIGDHGKVIAFQRIKTLALLTIGALVTALITVAVLVSVNQGLHSRARELKRRLESSHQQIQQLRQEKDLLTAHVVLVETRMKEALAASGRPAADQKPKPVEPGPPSIALRRRRRPEPQTRMPVQITHHPLRRRRP